eukprot:scaffold2929_cov145-Skeletonema_menzelii.AAC.11
MQRVCSLRCVFTCVFIHHETRVLQRYSATVDGMERGGHAFKSRHKEKMQSSYYAPPLPSISP